MKKYILTLLITSGHLLSASGLYAQDYAANQIPDSLKNNADAVIREYSAEFIQSDKNNAVLKEKRVVTVLKKLGESSGNFTTYTDKFQELNSFSGILRDANGKIIKKIKKGDLTVSSLSDQMSDDNTYLFYECKAPAYPYTIEYNYETKMKNGILSYPAFSPINRFGEAIEKANYNMTISSDFKVIIKCNYKNNLTKNEINGKTVYSASINNLKAIEWEQYSPQASEYVPTILFSPQDFCYDSYCGSRDNWTNAGLWMSTLLKDRDKLSPIFVEKLKELTKDAQNDREKVKILYEYLQKNTRYVSVQLGIGGLQPIDASLVVKTSYGDCKGLSNLMHAMLKAVDIPSNYCAIYLGNNNGKIYTDYPNYHQMNHAILMVPLKTDTVWLECTSAVTPFGFVHNQIAGHDAFVISDKGGSIATLPSYSVEENSTDTHLEITVDEDGYTKGNLVVTDNLEYYIADRREDQIRVINNTIQLPNASFGEIVTHIEKSERPFTTLKTSFESSSYTNVTGNRMFIPLSPVYKIKTNPLAPNKRNNEIDINSGVAENDTIIINIPQQYKVEGLPKEVEINTKYGFMITKITQEEGKIIFTEKFQLNNGRYDKSEYQEIKDFFAQVIAAAKKNTVVLRKI